MDPELDEPELARRARDGDREALGALVERLRPGLFALAYAELRHYEEAQDAVASALLQICRHVGDLREPERARAWIWSVARNEARRIRRRRSRLREDAAAERLEEMEDARSAPGSPGVPAADLRLDVERALWRLPRDQARAVALHYLAGLPVEEIARRTGRPAGTIKRWLHGGRRRLADELEEYGPMKRREALKLLAATPVVATALEGSGQPVPRRPVNAAIISSDLPTDLLKKMVAAARAAGFDGAITLDAPPSMEATGEGESREVHVPSSLKDVSVVVLDEWIAGRSAFEVLVSLKAAAEAKQMAFFMLAAAPKDSTVFAAHAAGVDCFLTKPFDVAEFQKFMRRLRERGAAAEGAGM
jgi:RNA polymerase sigma-70 factor (ECF subfamily)